MLTQPDLALEQYESKKEEQIRKMREERIEKELEPVHHFKYDNFNFSFDGQDQQLTVPEIFFLLFSPEAYKHLKVTVLKVSEFVDAPFKPDPPLFISE